jgi:DinB family protein
LSSPPKDRSFIDACLERARTGPVALAETCRGLSDEDHRRKPGVGKLSLLEHMTHMLDMERDVFAVRLRRVLEEEDPALDPVDQEHSVDESRYAGRTFAELMEEWETLRRANVELVERTGPDEWSRPVRHPDLGKATFADVVQRWSRHDADHLRQIEIIARNCRERSVR